MKIYLIGNYNLLNSKSMPLYVNTLKKLLIKSHKVQILEPKILLNKFNFKKEFIRKWIGYIDMYILFGIYLYFKIKKNDLVHICDQANSLLFPFIRTKKLIITCHDLISIELLKNNYLKKFNKISFMGKVFQKIILFYLKKFKIIICISQKTKEELLKMIKIDDKKIYVVHLPLNQKFSKLNKQQRIKFLKRKKINYPYFLHIGINWYKNRENLIKIFYQFIKVERRKNFKLILVGNSMTNNLKKLIIKLRLKDKIKLIQNPNFSELRSYYSSAEALIYPSIREGFGWPIIEAQKCGCPVFTTNKGPMNELGLDTVFYIDPIKSKISSKIIDKKLLCKEIIINKGFENVKRFNAKIFINKMKNIYNKVPN